MYLWKETITINYFCKVSFFIKCIFNGNCLVSFKTQIACLLQVFLISRDLLYGKEFTLKKITGIKAVALLKL